MERWAIRGGSAVLAMVGFGLARLAEVPAGIDLLLAFIGAVVGTAVGVYITRRLLARRAENQEQTPPARGSGRKAE